jgi:uncharacterized repeat protein (TIGR01451 family)
MNTHIARKYISIGRVARSVLIVLFALGLLSPTTAFAHVPGVTERVSVDSAGNQANDISAFLSPPAISTDGRFVAFDSAATNLIAGGNLPDNIFVHDRRTGATEEVSVSSAGKEGQGLSSSPALSADGRFVAFDSEASNLVAGDKNGTTDVFRHDRTTGQTILVSVNSAGKQANGDSHAPAISADGRFIAFHTIAALVPQDTNNAVDVYVRDIQTGVTKLVSVATDGTAGNNLSAIQAISADGRFVAFVSEATNLIPNDIVDTNPNVYVRDLVAGTTELASVGSDGTHASVLFNGDLSISADGRFVAFSTLDSLVPADTFQGSDIYLHDRQTGTTELISQNSSGQVEDGESHSPSVSADGRFVAFQSLADNIVPETSLFQDEDIFVRDRQTATTYRISESTDGMKGNDRSLTSSISGDGLVVAFSSDATNLVLNDTNGVRDIFVHDDRPAADLSVAITDAPDPVAKGANLTYSVVTTNNGTGSAVSVKLIDTLPSTVRFVSATPTTGSCAEPGGTVTCNLGDLANGASATVTISVKPLKAGTITNSAQVSSLSPDPNPANNTTTEQTVVTP